jgi:hypothetical protein
MLDVACLTLKLKVDGLVVGIFFNHLVVLKAELLALLDHSHLENRSVVLGFETYLEFLITSLLTSASVTPSEL